jgi:hypothetical protein
MPEGRLRIESNRTKSGWNTSITIGINGQWFEVEREEHGTVLRPFIYILRPASSGKILRGYQEYDSSSALGLNVIDSQQPQAQTSSAKK